MHLARSLILPCLLASLLAPMAHADTVSLIDGRTFEGKVSFDAKDGLVVLPKNQPSQRVELADVLSVRMDSRKIETPKRLATLVNGARVAAEEVLALGESEVRLKRPTGALLSLSPVLLASINFEPKKSPAAVVDSFVGVQTRGGDQSEGQVLGLENNRLRISSVLFGIQEFEVGRDLHTVHLRPAGVSRAAYVIKTTDGSTWHAASMKVDRGTLQLTTDTVGTIDLPGDSVVEIALGPASAEPIDGGAAIELQPGAPRQIPLDGKYRAVLLNLHVPPRFVPNRPVQFILSADGKQLKKTQPITSLNGSVSIAVSVDGKKSLEIRCIAEGHEALGVAGQITDARLVRRR